LAPSTSPSRRWHPAAKARSDGPLLYICGDPDGRILFTRIARRWDNMKLVVADGGRTGLQVALKRRPRLVALDALLPDLDGRDLVKYLRSKVIPSQTPIIVLAHDSDPRRRAEFIWAGASAYHSKPLNVAEVDHSVATLLEVAALR
jgi:DNA-binding response OmpR family regulator